MNFMHDASRETPTGPLRGIRIVEFAGVGPVQFAGMMFADMGADVIRIDRPNPASLLELDYDILDRGRRSITLDLKTAAGVAAALRLCETSDALIEGYRPGVMERLGLGPKVIESRNRRLVFGRATGWGQHGPLSAAAGHDINYIAISGALHAIGEQNQPSIPLNLIGDFGGGGMMLAFGVLSALFEAKQSGFGQVVDAAMTDGAASLLASIYSLHASGKWSNQRHSNLLDGGSPVYGAYPCADDRLISIGPLELKFYHLLLGKLGLELQRFPDPCDRRAWPTLRDALRSTFRQKTQQQWCKLLEGSDVCFAPVLNFNEAPLHPHNVARGTFIAADGVMQPAPCPRLSRTPGSLRGPPPQPGADTAEILDELGFSSADIARLSA
jgi:alpha-methylacyl-CoA racemase